MENPKKSLQEYYEQLKGIDEDFKRAEFFPPVSYEQIEHFEKENNMQIPESYKNWLFLSNGGYLIGGSVQLFGIYNDPEPYVGYDYTKGLVPKEYLILGSFESDVICFDKKSMKYFFYRYSDKSVDYDDFNEILDFIIDVCTN